jgi:hypothetical protein
MHFYKKHQSCLHESNGSDTFLSLSTICHPTSFKKSGFLRSGAVLARMIELSTRIQSFPRKSFGLTVPSGVIKNHNFQTPSRIST